MYRKPLVFSVFCAILLVSGPVGCQTGAETDAAIAQTEREIDELNAELQAANTDLERIAAERDRSQENLDRAREQLAEAWDDMTAEQRVRAEDRVMAAERRVTVLEDSIAGAERYVREVESERAARQADMDARKAARSGGDLISAEGVEGLWRVVAPYAPLPVQVIGGGILAALGIGGVRRDARIRSERDAARRDSAVTLGNARRVFRAIDDASTSDGNGNRITNKRKQREEMGTDLSQWVTDVIGN
jgi:outer membrane murein-binding lipoprotein Lpp